MEPAQRFGGILQELSFHPTLTIASSHRRNLSCGPAISSGNAEPGPAFETTSATLEPGPELDPEPGPAPALVPPPTPGSDSAHAVAYTEADLQRLLRICMGAKGPSNDELRESPLKTRFPDLYTEKSQMDCFHFCQQCEDHFETARATGTKLTSFASFFLSVPINQRWTQYKKRHQAEKKLSNQAIKYKFFEYKGQNQYRL